MALPRLVKSANGRHLWVERPDGGGLGRPFLASSGRGYARDRGLSPEDIGNAPVAETVVDDPLAPQTSFDPSTSVLVSEPEALERLALTSAAWLTRELLRDPANRRFEHLVVRHGDDIYLEQSAPWTLWDTGIYWPTIPTPGCDAVKRHVRLLSKGKHVTLSRAGKPSRRFLALDLPRTWALADAFEVENPEVLATWRKFGAANWKKLGRRCG